MFFCRRNTSSNVSYQQIKQYKQFKQLTLNNDIMILKQILPMVVKKVYLQSNKQQNVNKMYIQQQPQLYTNNQSKSNYTTRRKLTDESRTKYYAIQTKIYKLLKYAFPRSIPCMMHLKSFQKLNYLYRSDILQIGYNGYIYRKQDQVKYIYYVIHGQIRISRQINQKQTTICKIYQGSFFGLNQIKLNQNKRVLNAKSQTNNTIILEIQIDILKQLYNKDEEETYKKVIELQSEIQKIQKQQNNKNNQLLLSNNKNIKTISKNNLLLKNNKNHNSTINNINISQQSKQNKLIKAYQFNRRINTFQTNRHLDCNTSAFNKFIQNKSLLFKINDANEILPRNLNKKQGQDSNINIDFNKNNSVSKYYKRLNQHRLHTLFKLRNKNKKNDEIKQENIKRCLLLTSRIKNMYNQNKKQYDDCISKMFSKTVRANFDFS